MIDGVITAAHLTDKQQCDLIPVLLLRVVMGTKVLERNLSWNVLCNVTGIACIPLYMIPTVFIGPQLLEENLL